MKFKYILYLILANLVIAQTGPGGVGTSAINLFWLKANDSTQFYTTNAGTTFPANGGVIGNWRDQSGNANNVLSVSDAARPLFKNNGLNGFGTVDFNGTNHYLRLNNYTGGGGNGFIETVFAVVKVSDASSKRTVYSGDNEYRRALYANYTLGDSLFTASNGFTGGSPHPANQRARNHDAVTGSFYITRSLFNASTSNLSVSINNNTSVTTASMRTSTVDDFLIGANQYDNNATHIDGFLDGEVAEIIMFNRVLTQVEEIIVLNYLSAKYNIALTAPADDYFAYESTHKYDVTGIGQLSATSHTEANSDSLRLISSEALSNGMMAFIGHDNEDNTTWTASNAPSNMQRIAREWRLDLTSTLDSIDIQYDMSNINSGALPASYNTYVLLVDTDDDFSNATAYEMTNVSGNVYATANISFSDGAYISIASLEKTISFQSTSSSGSESVTNVELPVEINFVPQTSFTVTYSTVDGTATGGSDFTIAVEDVLSFNAGETVKNATITVIDDAVGSGSGDSAQESFDINLVTVSDPAIAIGDTTHTYTINDNEAPTIQFSVSSNSVNESSTNPSVSVVISGAPTGATQVTYTVHGSSTASGSGVDYTLATGTLTFPDGDGSSRSFNISVVNDNIFEVNETIVIDLSNPTNGHALGTRTRYTYTIIDDDATPTASFSSSSSSAVESTTPGSNFPIQISGVAGMDITLNYSLTGTATSGVDYSSLTGSVVITAGNTAPTGTFRPTIISDDVVENNETLILTIQSGTNYSIANDSIYTYTILDDDGYGSKGPGGVADTTDLAIWLSAEDSAYVFDATSGGNTLNSGGNVARWEDKASNANHVIQATGTSQPLYTTGALNGKAVITFDGGDILEQANYVRNSNETVFFVGRVTATADRNIIDGVNTPGKELSYKTNEYKINGNNNINAVAASNSYHIITAQLNGTSSASISANGGTENSDSDTFTDPVGFAIGGGSGTNFTGDIAEIIIVDGLLNQAQKVIIQTHLSAKYGIALNTVRYAYGASYGNNVIGIGQGSDGNSHLTAQADNEITLSNPDAIGNSDYVFIGHNDSIYDLTNSTDVDGISIQNRLAKVWAADLTGSPGNVDLTFNISGLSVTASDLRLLIDGDADGFADNDHTPITGTVQGDSAIVFSSVTLSDGDLFTLGEINSTQVTLSRNILANATVSASVSDIVILDLNVTPSGGSPTLNTFKVAFSYTGSNVSSAFTSIDLYADRDANGLSTLDSLIGVGTLVNDSVRFSSLDYTISGVERWGLIATMNGSASTSTLYRDSIGSINDVVFSNATTLSTNLPLFGRQMTIEGMTIDFTEQAVSDNDPFQVGQIHDVFAFTLTKNVSSATDSADWNSIRIENRVNSGGISSADIDLVLLYRDNGIDTALIASNSLTADGEGGFSNLSFTARRIPEANTTYIVSFRIASGFNSANNIGGRIDDTADLGFLSSGNTVLNIPFQTGSDIALPVSYIENSFIAERDKTGFNITVRTASEEYVSQILLQKFLVNKNTNQESSWETIAAFQSSSDYVSQGRSLPFTHDKVDFGNTAQLAYRYVHEDLSGHLIVDEAIYLSISSDQLEPISFKLNQNFPNPFNPTTNISFELPYAAQISLYVYSIDGKLVNKLIDNREYSSGSSHSVTWDGKNQNGQKVSSGIYYYRLISPQTNTFITKKMILLK